MGAQQRAVRAGLGRVLRSSGVIEPRLLCSTLKSEPLGSVDGEEPNTLGVKGLPLEDEDDVEGRGLSK